jgi:hypothetical protein
MPLTFILSLILYIIGKLIDPCGKKVGEANTTTTTVTVTVDDDYIERFINMLWDHWTNNTTTREDAIRAISPYVASKREDTYLQLVSKVLESMPDELSGVNKLTETWEGQCDGMFRMVDNHIREKESLRERQLLLEDVATNDTEMVTDDDDCQKVRLSLLKISPILLLILYHHKMLPFQHKHLSILYTTNMPTILHLTTRIKSMYKIE